MGEKWTRPLWADLTMESSREEVLAALEESDQRDRESAERMKQLEWPDVPEGFEGCVWSRCGTARAHYGRIQRKPHLEAQARAGEEDQSPPDDWLP